MAPASPIRTARSRACVPKDARWTESEPDSAAEVSDPVENR